MRPKKNTKICVNMVIIPFFIALLSTHVTWLLMTHAQEIRSSFGSDFTFMGRFGTLGIYIHGSWAYYLIPISEPWSLTFWPYHWYKLFHILTLLRDISLRWVAVCPLPDNITTLFSYRSYLLVIIYFSMLLVTIMLLVWYSPHQIV